MVELSFVTLIRLESELFEGVLETGDDFPAASFVVECTLAVLDGLLADDFNGLDVGFLPDENSAKEQCIVEMWFVCTTNGWLIVGHAERLFKLRSQTVHASVPSTVLAGSAHRLFTNVFPCLHFQTTGLHLTTYYSCTINRCLFASWTLLYPHGSIRWSTRYSRIMWHRYCSRNVAHWSIDGRQQRSC